MEKKPYFLTCPSCGHQRFVFPVVKKYRCASCGVRLKVRTGGSYLVEIVLLGPISLVFYWCVAEILNSHGLDRDASQRWGIFAGFLISLPIFGALRPYIVGVERDDAKPTPEGAEK